MFTLEEINTTFPNAVWSFGADTDDIRFVLDLVKLEIVSNQFLNLSLFCLESTGLLTLVVKKDGRPLEYHMKVKTLKDLHYAITHLDEWDDDWN